MAQSGQCDARSNLVSNHADTLPVGSDGLVHVTYAFVDSSGNLMTPDGNVFAAVTGSVGEWNSYKATTGIELDPLPSGMSNADVKIQYLPSDSTGATGGCAQWNPGLGALTYSNTFVGSAANSYRTGVGIMDHEFGHQFGLADAGYNPSPPSVMNNPGNGDCIHPNAPTNTVQNIDISTVPACRRIGRNNFVIDQAKAGVTTSNYTDPTPLVYQQEPGCTYLSTTWYYYVDGVFVGEDLEVDSINCTV